MKEHYSIISIIVEDEPGVLARIATMFARKGYNIETVNVGKIPGKNLASIIFTVHASAQVLEQLIKQTEKLIRVLYVNIHTDTESVVREHCLVCLENSAKEESKITEFAKKNSATVVYKGKESIVLELVSSPEKLDDFITATKPFTVKEVRRSGITAVTKNGY